MGDNYPIVAGPPRGPQLASDEINGVHYPRVKLSFGANGACGDVSGVNPLPVNIISGGGSSSNGLTNDELRATPLPISGTVSVGTVAVTGSFYPATQAVSIASMPSTPVTGTFWPATQPISGTVAVSGSVAVTGSFYQATQPVSIASMPSTPVTGTFWQTTQPISGTVTANINGTVPVSGSFFQATQPISIAATVATRHLRDNARTIVNAATAIAGVTAVTSEAMLALNVSRDGAATASATTIVVTSGKKLRIIGITSGVISTAAAVISARVSLRLNPTGAAVATSPIVAILPMSQQAAALVQAGDNFSLMFSEAIEISGAMQIGLSQIASATTGTIWASLIAYEY